MSDELDAYQTYLLHLWRARCKGEWQWRASLESPRTGERQSFAGLEQLFVFVGDLCQRRAPVTSETLYSRVGEEGTVQDQESLVVAY